MATSIRVEDEQSTREIKSYSVDFANELTDLETISGAAITHTPPSGTASTITATVVDTRVLFDFGPLSAIGNHQVFILVTTSGGYKHDAKLIIPTYW